MKKEKIKGLLKEGKPIFTRNRPERKTAISQERRSAVKTRERRKIITKEDRHERKGLKGRIEGKA